MVVVPPVGLGCTSPADDPIVATVGALLVQSPEGTGSVKVNVVLLPHIEDAPTMAPGVRLTVMSFVTKQPAGSLYVIVAVPLLIPYTVPVPLTLAIVLALLDHAPPGTGSVYGVFCPMQILLAPLIGPGDGLIVMVLDTMQQDPVV